MFKDIDQYLQTEDLTLLDTDGVGQPTSHELQVATVSILLSAARASNHVGTEELMRMTSSLFHEFGTNDEENGDLLAVAELLMKKPEKSDALINAVNKNFTAQQREHILSLAWRVFIADNHVDSTESAFAVELRKKLNLSLEQALRAQHLASSHSNINQLKGPGVLE